MIEHVDVLRVLDQIPNGGDSRFFHIAAAQALEAEGYHVQREVRGRAQPKGIRRGRIDLVLDGTYAVELDRINPRQKSIRKVMAFGRGLVYCRVDHRATWLYDGPRSTRTEAKHRFLVSYTSGALPPSAPLTRSSTAG